MIEPNQVFRNMTINENSMAWTVPHDLPYLDGHFPGLPVLPAVAMVDATTYILQHLLKRPDLCLRSVVSAKFQNPVGPGANVEIRAQETGAGEWQVEWKEASSARMLAVLRVQV